MKQNKRAGAFFEGFLVFTIIIILVTTLFIIVTRQSKTIDEVGQRPILIMSAVSLADNKLLFLDMAAVKALEQAEIDLALQGGFSTPDCKSIAGYSLWFEKTDCYPNIESELLEQFSINLDDYLLIAGLPINNYDMLIANNTIIAKARQDLVIPIDQTLKEAQQLSFSTASCGTPIPAQNGLVWPLDDTNQLHTVLTSCYGQRNCKPYCVDESHDAIDIDAVTGDCIFAVAVGEVIDVGGPYNKIVIAHENGMKTFYLHNAKNIVAKNDKVVKGQIIGFVGGYGEGRQNRYGDHLHFAIKIGDNYIDPLTYYGAQELKISTESNCYYDKNMMANLGFNDEDVHNG
ncbi:M23 family metallopeptidase [Candidatus Woesearchaeota archaeon]|nr:M23 family metallopeptidase [Candidatus Woesearchaeota archaeon]